jgi:hypothetical protein
VVPHERQLRRWLAREGVRGWVVDDLLVSSDEICFETILLPGVSRIEVEAGMVDGVVRLRIASDRRQRELRMVPYVTDVEVVDEIGPELRIVRHVADTLDVRTLPNQTIVELTKAVT